jgi:hypothetical protein
MRTVAAYVACTFRVEDLICSDTRRALSVVAAHSNEDEDLFYVLHVQSVVHVQSNRSS